MQNHPLFRLCALVCLLTAACAKPRPSGPAPLEVLEFEIPWAGAFPSDVVVDSEGVLWFTDRLQHRIGSFDYETKKFRSYPTPTETSAPYGMTTAADGSIWFAESRAGRLGRLDPRTGNITEYPLDGVLRGPEHLGYSEGRIWFSLKDARAYGWLDPRTGETRITATPFMQPYAVAVSQDTMVWFTDFDGWTLLHVNGRTFEADTIELPPPPRTGGIRRMSADPAGGLWFTDFRGGRVVAFDPATAALRSHTTDKSFKPYGIAADERGTVWYYDAGTWTVAGLDAGMAGRRVGVVKTKRSTVRDIAVDVQRGRVWLPMSDKGIIGLVLLKK